MRQTRVEQWSGRESPAHRLHASAKIVAGLVFLISTATLYAALWPLAIVYLALLVAGAVWARLPAGRLMLRAAAVLPFALCFALISAVSGEPSRAAMLLVRAYVSGLAALLLVATTPQTKLIAGLEALRAPRFLLEVMQFLYRYLAVLMQESIAMRNAGLSRGAGVRILELRRAAGAAAVLFSKAMARAAAIHNAMEARGYDGALPRVCRSRLRLADVTFVCAAAGLVVIPRLITR